MNTDFEYIQPYNPTDFERHTLLRYALSKVNRLEDFYNITNLLSPPPDITTLAHPGKFKGVKIGIIGAGLAGLSSAFELRKLGFDITIFEALENRVGGRVYTYYFDKDNAENYGELGPMRIPISHESTWHYINLFNLNTRPFIQVNEDAYIYIRNVRVKNDPDGKNVMKKIYPMFDLTPRERITPWQKLLEYGLDVPLRSIPSHIRKEILQIKPVYNPIINYWTDLSTRQVMELMGLSQGALNLLASVSPFAGSFYYNSYFENLQEDYPLDFAYMYEIMGGMDNLPLAFYKSLTSETPSQYNKIPANLLGKIRWKKGSPVRAIRKNKENNCILIEYTNKSNVLHESFDYVVCTIPFSSLRNVDIYPAFSSRKMQAIREVGYVTSQKTLLLCNKRFWEDEGITGGGSYTDLPISTIWYPSNPKRNVLLGSYNFTLDAIRLGNMPENSRIDWIKRQIEYVHGLPKGYMDSIVEDYKTVQWDNEEYFYGGFCYFMPQQKKIFSYAMITPEYNNRVFFAGEHTSPNHAWMQGALNSGLRAANELAKYCKIT